MNRYKNKLFNIVKENSKIKFLINNNKKIFEIKNLNHFDKKLNKNFTISDKFFINCVGLYNSKKILNKKKYKIFTKNSIYESKYKKKENMKHHNIFQIYYFNFRKNIMDNPEQIFNNKVKQYLLNNISIIKYL